MMPVNHYDKVEIPDGTAYLRFGVLLKWTHTSE